MKVRQAYYNKGQRKDHFCQQGKAAGQKGHKGPQPKGPQHKGPQQKGPQQKGPQQQKPEN